jgi:MFS family permease
MISSSIGGILISKGRLRVLDGAAILGIIGVALTLIENLTFILIGRFFYGFSTGLIAVSWPRYMEEVLPPSQLSFFGGLYCFSFAVATLIGLMLALGLPKDDDVEGLLATQFWRVIFGLPIVFFTT